MKFCHCVFCIICVIFFETLPAQASFTQKYKYMSKPQHTITISGLLFPNTVYNTYCSAEDPVTGVHSNWTAITRTIQTARTGGCFNCGNLVPPDVFVSGGFAGTQSIGLVATATEPGRIFCNAFLINGTMDTVITKELVREANYFAILTGTGITVSIQIGGLTASTEYEVRKLGYVGMGWNLGSNLD